MLLLCMVMTVVCVAIVVGYEGCVAFVDGGSSTGGWRLPRCRDNAFPLWGCGHQAHRLRSQADHSQTDALVQRSR